MSNARPSCTDRLSGVLRRRFSDTSGFTLIELLVGAAIALLVFTGVTTLMVAGMKDQSSVASRSYQLDQAQAGMQQLIRQLREATSVTIQSSSSISYAEPIATGTETISFSCSTANSSCTSSIAGATQSRIDDVTNTNVFAATPSSSSPTYVGITLVISAPKVKTVTLTDGVGLRNLTLGS